MAADTLHGLVLSAAGAHAARVAVTFDGGGAEGSVSLSYSELLSGAARLSGLLRDGAPTVEPLFGLYCEPGLQVPTWILGILQVPAAYVPLDPDGAPVQCVRVMEQSGLKFCVVQRHLVQGFCARFSGHISAELCAQWQDEDVALLRIRSSAAQQPGHKGALLSLPSVARSHRAARGALAYVLHTSGTTGQPKTVRVPHECIVPNIVHLRSLFQLTGQDVIFMASPLTFDPSVVDMFLALSSGASLLMVPPAVKRNPSRLANVLFGKHRTTVLQATPTLVCRFGRRVLREAVLSVQSPLRVLALGGEPCPSLAVLKSWRQEGNRTRIFNLYGTTETSCWSCWHEIPEEQLSPSAEGDQSVPLGTPLMGTMVEVRDEAGHVLAEGEGQVFTGGERRVCLLDDEVAVAAGTMRGTGDWVELRHSHLYYLGRRDRLVKRNGQQLHLDAVHRALAGLPQVDACAVMLREARLLAFVVPAPSARDSAPSTKYHVAEDVDGDSGLSSGTLKRDILRRLTQLLPAHGVPDALVTLSFLPLTAHGKVSMDELWKVYQKRRKASLGSLADCDALAQELRTLWREALGLPDDTEISSDANFLLSGGDSLQCLRLSDEITFSVDMDPTELLEVLFNGSFADVVSRVAMVLFSKDVRKSARPSAQISSQELVEGSPTQPPEPSRKRSAKALDSPSKESLLSELLKRPPSPHAVPERAKRPAVVRKRPVEFVMLRRTGEIVEMGLSVLSLKGGGDALLVRTPTSERAGPPRLRLRVRWTSDTGRCVDASPVLLVTKVDKTSDCTESTSEAPPEHTGAAEVQLWDHTETTVFIGSHSHRLQALDFSTGALRWERVLGGRIESSAVVTTCGRFVAVGCYDGQVYFLRADTGETRWTFGTGDAVKSSPTADPLAGLVFVGSHDGHVYALDPERRGCVWRRSCGGGAVFSSPCLRASLRQLYVATLGGRLLCLDADTGAPLWTHTREAPFFSSPSCSCSCVCIGAVDGSICGFSHAGDTLWQFSTDGPVFSSPCLTPSRTLVCGSHDGSVYCVSCAEGELLWRFTTPGKVFSSPLAFDGSAWGRGMLVALCSTEGTLWLLDGQCGSLVASLQLPGELFSSPVLWQRSLVVGCRNDLVYCIDITEQEAPRAGQGVKED
ncbi:acyl-CoA synthetase family member 4 isoform X1 [Arapaima gigas]